MIDIVNLALLRNLNKVVAVRQTSASQSAGATYVTLVNIVGRGYVHAVKANYSIVSPMPTFRITVDNQTPVVLTAGSVVPTEQYGSAAAAFLLPFGELRFDTSFKVEFAQPGGSTTTGTVTVQWSER